MRPPLSRARRWQSFEQDCIDPRLGGCEILVPTVDGRRIIVPTVAAIALLVLSFVLRKRWLSARRA